MTRSKYFRGLAAAVIGLLATCAFAQDTAAPLPATSGGTTAFVAEWPVYTKGDPPVMYVAGEGILQIIVLAPEILKLVLDASTGVDVKARAAEIKSFIETARPVNTADCSVQDDKIRALTTQVGELQDDVKSLQADKATLETEKAALDGRAASAERSVLACEANMTAAKSLVELVRAEIEAAAAGLRTTAGKAVIEAPPPQ